MAMPNPSLIPGGSKLQEITKTQFLHRIRATALIFPGIVVCNLLSPCSSLALCPLSLFPNFCLQHLFSIKSLSKQTFPEQARGKLGAECSAPLTFPMGWCPLFLNSAFNGRLRMEELGSWITLEFWKQGIKRSLFSSSPAANSRLWSSTPGNAWRGF